MHRIRTIALAAVLVAFAPAVLPAQTVTAFKTGEATTGMTKQCYYDALGSAYTKTYSSVTLCPLTIQVASPGATTRVPAAPSPAAPPVPAPSPRSTVTGFLKGEKTTGMTKQCYYDALGSEYTKTYSSVTLCPLTIQVKLN